MRLPVMILALGMLYGCGEQKEKVKDKEQRTTAATSRFSTEFSSSIDSIMRQYEVLTTSFVNWDTASIVREAARLSPLLDHIPQGEIAVQQQRTSALIPENMKS